MVVLLATWSVMLPRRCPVHARVGAMAHGTPASMPTRSLTLNAQGPGADN